MIETFLRGWYRFWIWILYAARLRRPLNNLQRRIAGELDAPTAPLDRPPSVESVRLTLHGIDWRKDGTRIGGVFVPLDYISRAEVTQWRLNNAEHADGDCDDVHHWAAVILRLMPGIDDAIHVSIGYQGGGHVACCYLAGGQWHLLNYGQRVAVERLQDVEGVLLQWAARVKGHDVGKRARWLVFESVELDRVKP